MIESIKELLFNISSFFTTIWDFVLKMFEDLVYIVQITGQALASVPKLFSFLPTPLLVIIIAIISVVVVYKVMGREG